MTSEVRYEIKNFITCYLTWNIDTKIRVGPYATNSQLILVDPVDDEEIVHELILLQ